MHVLHIKRLQIVLLIDIYWKHSKQTIMHFLLVWFHPRTSGLH